MISTLKEIDTLIVTKLDRLSRNIVEGIQIIEDLFNRGVAVIEMERNIIIERTQIGKEIARKDPNFVEDIPKICKRKQIDPTLSLLENHTYKQINKLT